MTAVGASSPGLIAVRLALRRAGLRDVIAGLEGRRFSWGAATFKAHRPMLRALGVTLVTRSRIEKRGWRLTRGARPVGQVYFEAPIGRYAEVYVAECHCLPKDPPKSRKEKRP